MLKAREYVAGGKRWVVDMDLEKFFDRVNHDVLMARVARRVKDKRVLRLVRRELEAGVMDVGLVSPTTEGTPQGCPLSTWALRRREGAVVSLWPRLKGRGWKTSTWAARRGSTAPTATRRRFATWTAPPRTI